MRCTVHVTWLTAQIYSIKTYIVWWKYKCMYLCTVPPYGGKRPPPVQILNGSLGWVMDRIWGCRGPLDGWTCDNWFCSPPFILSAGGLSYAYQWPFWPMTATSATKFKPVPTYVEGQCPGMILFLTIMGQNPSGFPSPTGVHVAIFRPFSSLHFRHIRWIPLKWWVNFHEVSTFDQLFLKVNRFICH